MIGALILGLVAGAVARLVIPNDGFEHLEGWKSWLGSPVGVITLHFVCRNNARATFWRTGPPAGARAAACDRC